jgi:hypothetical protein
MTYQIRPAVRENVKPLIGLYGQSGCGKTYSALLLARGLVGPNGRILMIDTESGRGSLYADVLPGGYDVLDLGEPFSSDRYIEAVKTAEKASGDCLIIDSASHEWEGLGGVLDMAADREKASGKPGLHCWKEPKLRHQRFMLKLLQSSLPVIVCLRAKYKSRQVKNPRTGKSEIVKDEHTSPQQADDFIYEMTVHGEILQDHRFRLTKCSHPDLRGCFAEGQSISVATGEAIAAWATGGATPKRSNGIETDPLDMARLAARAGRAAFKAWWNGEGRAHREDAKPYMEELQALVEEAESQPEEDPFGKTAGTPEAERADEPDLLAAG